MKHVVMTFFLVIMLGSIGISSANSAPAPIQGDTLFRQRCQTCHSVTAGKASGIGPNLAGVMGRRTGSTAFSYSAAMKAKRIVWSRLNMDRFLANPQGMFPGSQMTVSVTSPQDRKAIIDYLTLPR